jgi:hypothetical protein
MKMFAPLAALLVTGLAAAGPSAAQDDSNGAIDDVAGGRIPRPMDPAALARLRRNSGVTLQWIDWEHRGRLVVSERNGRIRLSGGQRARSGPGRLELDGELVSIAADRFAFRGRILIADTPDPGRDCLRDGTFEFRITGRRRYWRLQQMEQCDGLTDYVDIYF